MNRRSRRHPTHPLLPILYPSNEGIPDAKGTKGKVNSKKGGSGIKDKKSNQTYDSSKK